MHSAQRVSFPPPPWLAGARARPAPLIPLGAFSPPPQRLTAPPAGIFPAKGLGCGRGRGRDSQPGRRAVFSRPWRPCGQERRRCQVRLIRRASSPAAPGRALAGAGGPLAGWLAVLWLAGRGRRRRATVRCGAVPCPSRPLAASGTRSSLSRAGVWIRPVRHAAR